MALTEQLQAMSDRELAVFIGKLVDKMWQSSGSNSTKIEALKQDLQKKQLQRQMALAEIEMERRNEAEAQARENELWDAAAEAFERVDAALEVIYEEITTRGKNKRSAWYQFEEDAAGYDQYLQVE